MSQNTTEEKPRSISQRMGIAALILSVSILLSRLLGFFREVIISTQHGAGLATDAYYAAFTLPELMNYFLAGGTLSITFIPLFSEYMSRDDEEGGWRLFSIVATTMGAILLFFTIIAFLLADVLVPFLAPFENAAQLELAVKMTRIVLPAQLAFYFGGLLQATLFVREVFWPSALAPLIYNLCIILGGIVLAPWMGIEGFSVGVLVGALLGPFALPLWASRHHVKYRVLFTLRDPGFRQFALITLPLMIGATLVTVDEWLLRRFGASMESGSITWLNQSRKLMMVLFAVIGQAAGQAALPFLTRLFHEGKFEEMGQMLSTSLQRVVFLSFIASAGLASIASPLVFTVFHRGAFTVADCVQTSELLMWFCLGLTSWAVQALVVRGFYARQNTWMPMLIGTGVLAVMLPIYWTLSEHYGVVGLALSTSIGITLNVIVTLIVYRRYLGDLALLPAGKSAARAFMFSAICGLPTYFCSLWLRPTLSLESFWTALANLSISSCVFAILFVVLFVVFKPEELDVVWDKVRRKLGRGRK